MQTEKSKNFNLLINKELLVIYFSALLGALIFISLMGHHTFRIEAMDVRISIQPAVIGYTAVEIPPLAEIKSRTHATPLKITLRLESIDLPSLQKLLESKQNQNDIINNVTRKLQLSVAILAFKALFLSAVGGFFGVFLWHRKIGTYHLKGALSASLAMGVLLAGTLVTYDLNKFKNPEFEGALKTAPWVMGLASETMGQINTLNAKMEKVAENINELFDQIDTLQTFDKNQEGLVKVLHVSDIHNNPAALGYIQRFANQLKVDVIIDTGDITDYGTPLEAMILQKLAGIKIPYLFIPGNHDSPETIKKMRSIPGVTVLDGSVVTFSNLRIMGIPDPSSKSNDIQPPPLDTINTYSDQIEISLQALPQTPDILAIHNHRIAQRLSGKAPVILYGHDHKLAVKENADSVMINSGSTGAGGMRRLQGERIPYSMVIQYYAPIAGKMKLLAVDTITIQNLESGFHIDRFFFKD